jgi:hypothetical protein
VQVKCIVPEPPTGDVGGSPVKISGEATNCSNGPEDIVITITPEGGSTCRQEFLDVPAGQSVTLNCDYICTEAGIIEFTVTAVATNDCGSTAPATTVCEITCEEEGENCPRTPGFWTQQCAQKGNGSTKFTRDEVTKIASCVDDASVFFDWADDFAGFCSKIDPDRPMNQYKQLQRHFAALLANYCTGELQLIANNGNIINLALSTKIDCEGVDAETIGELIKEIDKALLDGDSEKYGDLLYCADAINNGDNIPLAPDCGEDTDDPQPNRQAALDRDSFRMGSPYPNPFRRDVVLTYSVPNDNQRVEIGVYNVAGRLVRNLVSSSQGSGQYEISWDGRDNSGSRVSHGVYFVRGRLNGQPAGAPTRVLYLP